MDFLTDDENQSAKGITILIDANAVEDPYTVPPPPRSIPFVPGLGDELGPTIVYFSSPNLRYCKKKLNESLMAHHAIYIMNPWTGFELELL